MIAHEVGGRLTSVTVRPGDVIDVATGIHRIVERMVVHSVHYYPGGSASVRARYLSNPRGVDWRIFIDVNEPPMLVSRGVAAVDPSARSLLP